MKNKETKFVAMATNTHKETIGDFVKKHTGDDKHKVYLFKYCKDYLNEENSDLFYTLVACTTFSLIAKINEDKVEVVNNGNGKCYASYDYDCPVVDVYETLLTQMSAEVKRVLLSVEEQYIKDNELRIPATNPTTYNALREFANDFGIEYTEGWDKDIKVPYMDIIGITPLHLT